MLKTDKLTLINKGNVNMKKNDCFIPYIENNM